MSSSPPWRAAPARTARPWLSLVVFAGHGLLLWGLLQLDAIADVVRQAAPLVVQIVSSPERPPEPAPPLRVLPPSPALPQVVVTVPVPEVQVQREEPAPTITVQAVAAPPAPAAAQTVAAAAAVSPPAPPPSPAPLQVPASALRYLVEPPVEVPRVSRRLRETGTVLLRVVVDTRGLPRSVLLQQSSGFDRLDQQALGAMRQARFIPCTHGGKPVECESTAALEYTLEN